MAGMQGVDELDLSKTPYDGCGKCWVGMIRLSSLKDTSDSPEKQVEHNRKQAAASGGHIIGWAVDLDVSGATNPFERKGFGPWLKGNEGPYDGVLASAVDRIGRSLLDVLSTENFLTRSGKAIITYGHGVWDFTDQSQRQSFNFQALAADIELGQIKRRSSETKERQRTTGHKVGRLSHGYVYLRRPDGHVSGIAIDHKVRAMLEACADRILADRKRLITPESEAQRLTREGVLSPSDYRRVLRGEEPLGAPWYRTPLVQILTSPATQGYYIENGKSVLDAEGNPIRIAPPLWDYAKHVALRKKLAPRPRGAIRAPKSDALLIGSTWCGNCSYRLYLTDGGRKLPDGTWPHRMSCQAKRKGFAGAEECKPAPSISMAELEEIAEARFLAEFGSLPVFDQTFDPGNDTTARLAEARDERDRLKEDRAAGLYKSPSEADWYRENYLRLSNEIEALEALPQRPAKLYWRPTGSTVADEWHRATSDLERRELLSAYDFRIEVYPEKAAERIKISYIDPDTALDARQASWEAYQRDMEVEAEYLATIAAEQTAAEADDEQAAEEYTIPSASAAEQAALFATDQDGAGVLHLVS